MRPGSGTMPARKHLRSGFYTAKRALVAYGSRSLPGPETPVGQALAAWRQSLIDDLGGAEALSTQRAALVEEVVMQRLLLDGTNAFLATLPSPVNKRKRCYYPIIRERAGQVALLQSLLRDLGLER